MKTKKASERNIVMKVKNGVKEEHRRGNEEVEQNR